MKIDLDFIIDTIQSKTNLDLNKNTRERAYVLGRAMYYKIAKEYTFRSLKDIGAKFGKDHATVLHGIKVFEGLKMYDKDLYKIYEDFHNRYPVELVNQDDEEVIMTDREKSIVDKFAEMIDLIKAKDEQINRLNIEIDLMKHNGDDKRSNILKLASQVPEEQLEVFEERISAMVKMIR